MSPQRIQRKRTKGWRMPEGAVYVGRPSRWGNWHAVRRNAIYRDGRYVGPGGFWIVVSTDKWGHERGAHWGAWENKDEATAFAVLLYRHALDATYVEPDGRLNREFYLGGLRGKDLACWCPVDGDAPCHADVLLELANA